MRSICSLSRSIASSTSDSSLASSLPFFAPLDEQLLELFVGVDELRRGERGDPLFIELLALFLLLRLLLRVLGQQLVGHGLEFLLAVVLFTHICFPP